MGAAGTFEDLLETLSWRVGLYLRYGPFGPHMRSRWIRRAAVLDALPEGTDSDPFRALQRHGARPDLLAAALLCGARLLGEHPDGDAQTLALAAWCVLDGGAADVPPALDSALVVALAARVAAACGSAVHVLCAGSSRAQEVRERTAALWCNAPTAPTVELRPTEALRCGVSGQVVFTFAAAVAYTRLDTLLRGGRTLGVGVGVGGLLGAQGTAHAQAATVFLVADAETVLVEHARQAAVLDSASIAAPARVAAALEGAQQIGRDAFVLGADGPNITLAGRQRLGTVWPTAQPDAAFWVGLGWMARHVLRAGTDYEVADGAVRLADAPAGLGLGPRERAILEAMLARMHGLAEPPRETILRLTVAQTVRGCGRLGAAGTGLARARAELWSSYGLSVVGFSRRPMADARACIVADTAQWSRLVLARIGAVGADNDVWVWAAAEARDVVAARLRGAGVTADGAGTTAVRLLEPADFDSPPLPSRPVALLVGGTPGRGRLERLARLCGGVAETILDYEALVGKPAGRLARVALGAPGAARNQRIARLMAGWRHRRMANEESALRTALLAVEDKANATVAFAGGDRG